MGQSGAKRRAVIRCATDNVIHGAGKSKRAYSLMSWHDRTMLFRVEMVTNHRPKHKTRIFELCSIF